MREDAGPVGEGAYAVRYFRRLPPLLRVASLLGLLFPLASLALLVPLLVTSLPSFPQSFSQVPSDFDHRGIIGLNLGLLGGACSVAVNAYSTRFRRPDRGPFLLSSWQSQMRAVALLSVLPLCGIALALVIPPTSLAFVVVFPISLLAAVVVSSSQIVGVASSGAMRIPLAG